MKPFATALILALLSTGPLPAVTYEAPLATRGSADAKLAAGPTVEKAGSGAKISFAVSAATDVEVAIVDREGRVVRHLAAGLLGEHAPAPLAANSLKQELTWDGKDDAGKIAAGENSVRVRVGSQARLDRHVGWDPLASNEFIPALAVGPTGELYVLSANTTYGRSSVTVFDRAGKYLRTVLPYPASTPDARADAVGRLQIGGEKLPIVFDAHAHATAPLTAGMGRQSMFIQPGTGALVLASAVGTIANHGPMRHLLAMAPRGGGADGMSFIGPEILPARGFMGGAGERGAVTYDGLAPSPDGKWTYVTTDIGSSSFAKFRRHGVWRVDWSDKALGQPFLGAAEAGNDDTHFNDPQGIATDAAGRIYVCDRGNNRVMIFTPDGKPAGRFAVDSPQQIAVHPGGGAVYVVSRKPGQAHKIAGSTLLKFAPFQGGTCKELMHAALDKKGIEAIAIDPSADAARLWASICVGWENWQVVPVGEKDGAFTFGTPLLNRAGLCYPMFIHADPARGTAYVTDWHAGVKRLDLATGKVDGTIKGNEAVPAADGNLYLATGWQLIVRRTDARGKPLELPDGDKQLGPWPMGGKSDDEWARSKGPQVGDRGHVFAPNGDLYIIVMPQYGPGRVDVYSPDGKLKKQGLIDNLPHGTSSIGVDPAGNVYLGVNLRPRDGAGPAFPFGFADQVPAQPWYSWRKIERKAPWIYPYYNSYLYHWGGVMKFGPQGGRFDIRDPQNKTAPPVVFPAGVAEFRNGYLNREVAVQGALWHFMGAGPVPSCGLNWGDPSCTCNNLRLAVDAFGRVFAPDAFRFSVEMLDNAGNQIARIGRYGNVDDPEESGGADLHFAWAAFADFAGDRLYVSDSVNRRISIIRFDWKDEKSCPIE
ncbi:MAG: hypothetical protein BIFFINMI_04404 [Phycisphaerae bacterium]|nr:hypothetical protein [Phycisphaerae bacterium]